MAARCIAYLDDGRVCGRGAAYADPQRGGMVCYLHSRAIPQGWHWLKHKVRQYRPFRIAHWDGECWRITDTIGRSRRYPSSSVGRLYDHVSHIPEPSNAP